MTYIYGNLNEEESIFIDRYEFHSQHLEQQYTVYMFIETFNYKKVFMSLFQLCSMVFLNDEIALTSTS